MVAKFHEMFRELPQFMIAEFQKSRVINTPADTTAMHIRRQLQYGQLTDSEKWLIENYRSIVGKIGWPAKCVRPDLSQTFSMLSRALADPQPCDARTLRKALQYIYHHQDEPMEMKRPSWFIAGKTPLELLAWFFR